VSGIPELLDDLGLLGPESLPGVPGVEATALGAVETSLVRCLADGRGTVDELVASTGQGSATVLAALTSLEMRGLVLEAFGRYRVTGVLAARRPKRRSVIRDVGARDHRPAA
jgi:hypothetical protein